MHTQPSVFSPVLRIHKQAAYHIAVTNDNGPLSLRVPPHSPGCPASS